MSMFNVYLIWNDCVSPGDGADLRNVVIVGMLQFKSQTRDNVQRKYPNCDNMPLSPNFRTVS